jgi:hypothetical protein
MILSPQMTPFLATVVPSQGQEVRIACHNDFEMWRQEPPGTCSRHANTVNPAALPANPLYERSFMSLLFLIISVLPWELQVMVQVRSLRERFF